MQFPFLPVGVKWNVVKNVHCPLLLINTGLMSIDPLTKKLLQKHHPVSCSKNEENMHFPHGPLLKAPELSRLDAHWDGLCGLVLITSSENDEKEDCETWSALPFWRSHCLDFLGQVDLELLPFIAECVTNIEKLNQPPSLSSVCLMRMHASAVLIQYFKLTQAVRTDPYAKMEMLAWTFDIYI